LIPSFTASPSWWLLHLHKQEKNKLKRAIVRGRETILMYANTDIFTVNAANFERESFNFHMKQTDLLCKI
jgi:hypothetical protein